MRLPPLSRIVHTLLSVILSVLCFVPWNIAPTLDSPDLRLVALSLPELLPTFFMVLACEILVASWLAPRMARAVSDPRRDPPLVFRTAMTGSMILVMCPLMSFLATLVHTGLDPAIVSRWLPRMVHNFPFAFFLQLFVVQPVAHAASSRMTPYPVPAGA